MPQLYDVVDAEDYGRVLHRNLSRSSAVRFRELAKNKRMLDVIPATTKGDSMKNEVVKQEEKHDQWGPSSHQALVQCPAYIGRGGDSLAASLGTFKHEIMEKIFRGKMKLEDVRNIKEWRYGNSSIPFTSDDVMDIHIAKENTDTFLERIKDTYGCDFEVSCEERVNLSILGITHGTADVVARGDGVVAILDYKFGKKPVSAHSEQFKSYALGVLDSDPLNDYDQIVLGVNQPATEPSLGAIRITRTTLDRHLVMMREIIACAKSGHAPRITCDYCRYCARVTKCSAAQVALEQGAGSLAIADSHSVDSMTNGELERVIRRFYGLDKLVGAIKAEAMARMLNGVEIEGLGIENGRASRVWTDEEEAMKAMNQLAPVCGFHPDDMLKVKFVSPAQAEKLLKKKKYKDEIAKFIMKKEGKPKLVLREKTLD